MMDPLVVATMKKASNTTIGLDITLKITTISNKKGKDPYVATEVVIEVEVEFSVGVQKKIAQLEVEIAQLEVVEMPLR